MLHLALIAVFAAVAVSSAAYNGIPFGNDLTQHYQFAASVEKAISSGHYFPSIAPSPNNGLGDYGLRFYPPLGYYALALGFELTGGWFGASILVFFLIYFLGGLGVYKWVAEEFPSRQAIIAAAIYVFAPYHLNQVYNNFLFGEFAASAVIPFCFLFLHRTAAKPSVRSAAALAAAYGALILTHLPSLIFCSIAFAVYGSIILIRSGTYKRAIPALAAAVCTALAATSVYWIKLVTELNWINHSKAEYFSNIYGYANNFLLRPQNILNTGDDVLAIWLGDLMLLAMVLISVPSVIFVGKRLKKVPPILLASLMTMLFSAFMASVLSRPLWEALGFLQKIQFPWRWLGVVSVTGAVFASYGIAVAADKLRENQGPLITISLGAGLLVFVISAIFITKQAVFIPPSEFTNAKISAVLSSPSRDCWWTVWADKDFFRGGGAKAQFQGKEVQVARWDELERSAELNAGEGGEAIFSVQYYPHWRAYSGNRRLETSPSQKGLLAVKVPSGASEVTIRFREPDIVRAAAVVSAAGWSAIIFAIAFGYIRRSKAGTPESAENVPRLED